jgi:hypothetical protein
LNKFFRNFFSKFEANSGLIIKKQCQIAENITKGQDPAQQGPNPKLLVDLDHPNASEALD